MKNTLVRCCLAALAVGAFSAGGFAGPAAERSPWYAAARLQETWTDNVRLAPADKKSDMVTELDLWLRYRLNEDRRSAWRAIADVKQFSYAHHSFDSYAYSAVGLEYRRQPARGRELEIEYAHLNHASYSHEAPFHLYEGDRVTLAYRLRPRAGDNLEWSYRYTARHWDPGARDRDGHNNEIGVTYARDRSRAGSVSLGLSYDKESTAVALDNQFERVRADLSLQHPVGQNTRLTLSGSVSRRDYVGARKDDHSVVSLDAARELSPTTSAQLGVGITSNNSTVSSRSYDARFLSFEVLHRFE